MQQKSTLYGSGEKHRPLPLTLHSSFFSLSCECAHPQTSTSNTINCQSYSNQSGTNTPTVENDSVYANGVNNDYPCHCQPCYEQGEPGQNYPYPYQYYPEYSVEYDYAQVEMCVEEATSHSGKHRRHHHHHGNHSKGSRAKSTPSKHPTTPTEKSLTNKSDYESNGSAHPSSDTVSLSHKSKHTINKRKCCRGARASRICVIFAFIFFILGAIAAFFCWPRTPLVSMGSAVESGDDPVNWGTDQHPMLHSSWIVNATFDNSQNWIPTHITGLDFYMKDSLTLRQFGWGTQGPMVFAPRKIISQQLRLTVEYSASSTTDPTFQNLYRACGPQKKGDPPSLNVVLHMSFHFWGIMWVPTVAITPPTGGFICPLN
ncbi:hypothetical protein CLU79DRAFT_891390 [Phycomyces nitens]|nr:hypothetical protein CLU79DRAFT_891390 [Phycomyces nitens]